MLKVLYGLKNFEGKSKFKTWLYSITYNECITQYRKERRKRRLMDALSLDPLEEASEERRRNPRKRADSIAGWCM
jgi:RNA polymerase sigma-70 factor (ECF subfamily)